MARQHGADPLPADSSRRTIVAPEHAAPSDELLLERARHATADERAALLEQLYRRHYAKVAGWCVAISRDEADAEELAQEVFLKVHRGIDSFRCDSRFTTWLYVITRRAAIDRAQSAKRRESHAVPADGELAALAVAPEALRRYARNQAAATLRRAVRAQLEPLEARALLLHYVSGMTLPAITRLLDLHNRSGAKALLVSALRKLRRHFADEPGRAGRGGGARRSRR
jgi:RNA polymerase sigma-70 factor (ECF subfamily)